MNKSQRKRSARGQARKPRAAFNLRNAGDQIVKRITFPNSTLATGAGTTIPITSISSSVAESSGTEFASFAARYQQYRVRAIRVTGKATQPIQTATVTHSSLYRGDHIGSSAPVSAAQVLSDENVKICSTHQSFVDIVTWARNPNARLWNPTSAALPVANAFSWSAVSADTPLLLTATTYYALNAEFEVEFRGSQ
jgi:hypothetical protein